VDVELCHEGLRLTVPLENRHFRTELFEHLLESVEPRSAELESANLGVFTEVLSVLNQAVDTTSCCRLLLLVDSAVRRDVMRGRGLCLCERIDAELRL